VGLVTEAGTERVAGGRNGTADAQSAGCAGCGVGLGFKTKRSSSLTRGFPRGLPTVQLSSFPFSGLAPSAVDKCNAMTVKIRRFLKNEPTPHLVR